MPYLSDYLDPLITKVHEKHGAFFAFSDSQLKGRIKEDVKYVALGTGLVCPKENAVELIKEQREAIDKAIQMDIAENGKDAIIVRELYNHEAMYVYSIEDTVDVLEDYDISRGEIKKVFQRLIKKGDY